jgi:hypothetical protein
MKEVYKLYIEKPRDDLRTKLYNNESWKMKSSSQEKRVPPIGKCWVEEHKYDKGIEYQIFIHDIY